MSILNVNKIQPVGSGQTLTINAANFDIDGGATITAAKFIGEVQTTGIVTASSFVGDGSGLTNVVGSGAGTTIFSGGTLRGTATTIDFTTNVDVSTIAAGILTVSVSDAPTFTGDVSVGTGATTAFFDVSTGYIGIGTDNPQGKLVVSNGSAGLEFNPNSGQAIVSYNRITSTYTPIGLQGSTIGLYIGGVGEVVRIDSSGRLGIGTTTVDGGGTARYGLIQISGNSGGNTGGTITLARGSAPTIPSQALGSVYFTDGTDEYGAIRCITDGAPAPGDAPGRLSFQTTATGASSPTERMQIDSSGRLLVGTNSASTVDRLVVQANTSSSTGAAVLGLQVGTTTVSAGVDLGYLNYCDSSGNRGAWILGEGDGAWTSGSSHPGRLVFSTTADSESTPTERLRIDSTGRLLVGTTSSSSNGGYSRYGLIQVEGNQNNSSGSGILTLRRGEAPGSITNNEDIGVITFASNDGNEFAWIRGQADGGTGVNDYPGRLTFSTTSDSASTPTERMRIDSSGVIYMNTTVNPGSARLSISQDFNARNGLGIKNAGAQGGGQYFAIFYNNANAIAGSISHNGSATVAFNTSSDYRLKENITPVVDGITRLQQLRPSRFNFIADPDKTVDGFIAHEVQTIVPEAITGEKDAVDDEGNPVYQGIDKAKLVPLLTAALQEAIAKIETLEAKVTALEGS